MRNIKQIENNLSLYEIKACYDIGLISLHTTLDNNDKLRTLNNVYRFIYGDTNSPEDHDTSTLVYRYRSVKDLDNTAKELPEYSSLDIIEYDIQATYIDRYGANSKAPQYGTTVITEDVLKAALGTLRKTVISLLLKLYHNETVYTLLLQTPLGRYDLYQRVTKNFYGMHKEDIYDMDFSSFRAYLLRKGTRIQDMEQYIDIQGLVFFTLKQYFSEVKARPEIQQKYALYSAKEIETSKGVMDRSSRDLLEMKETVIPEYSLTKIFTMCRKLDESLFLKRHESNISYSILEWYAEYLSGGLREHLQDVSGCKNRLEFSNYQTCFENTVLQRQIPSPARDDFSLKINAAKEIFKFLYEKWYLQKESTISRANINKLCAMCEHLYNHCVINYDTGELLVKERKTNGVLDISSKNPKSNHYINLEYYQKASPEDCKKYTCITFEDISIYLDPNIQAMVAESDMEIQKDADNYSSRKDFKYVLLPEGVKRIREIMDIFQELEEVARKVEKIGATLQELLPAFYNGKPCTLDGALTYVLQEKRTPTYKTSDNPLFDSGMLLRYGTPEDSVVFDWSLDKWYKDYTNTNIQAGVSLTTATSRLIGLNPKHYPRYPESMLFTLLTQAFPDSIVSEDNENHYIFMDNNELTMYSGEDGSTIGVHEGVDYDAFATNIGCMFSQEQEDLFKNLAMDLPEEFSGIAELFNSNTTTFSSYRVDLRKEFFTQNGANSLYVIFIIAIMLFDELNTYKTNSYSSKYIGLSAHNKVHWSKFVNEVHNGFVRDLGPRIDDVISRIAPIIQKFINSDISLSNLHDYEVDNHPDRCVATSIIAMILEPLKIKGIDVPSLAEKSIDDVRKRIVNSRHLIEPLIVKGTRYILSIASIDRIIFDGDKYDVVMDGNTMYAVPYKQDLSKAVASVPLSFTVHTPLKMGEGWKHFFSMTQNNAALRYTYDVWEPAVKELIRQLCKVHYSTSTLHTVPLILTTRNIWELVRDIFGSIEPNSLECSDPDCPPSKIIEEMTHEVTNPNGFTETVYEYYWRLHNDGSEAPYVLDYLIAWNNSRMILESFSDVHQLAYALSCITKDTKYMYNSEYSEYLSQGFSELIDCKLNNGNTMPTELNWAVMVKATDNGSSAEYDGYCPYRNIKWSKVLNDVEKDTAMLKRYNAYQSAGVKAYLDDPELIPRPGTEIAIPWDEVLQTFLFKINSIKEKSLFPVKGIDESAADISTKIKIYNFHKNRIAAFVAKNKDILNTIRIGMERTGKSLQSTKFYRSNKWTIDSDTGILTQQGGVPCCVSKDNTIGFLHYLGYWICLQSNNPDNITYCFYSDFMNLM